MCGTTDFIGDLIGGAKELVSNISLGDVASAAGAGIKAVAQVKAGKAKERAGIVQQKESVKQAGIAKKKGAFEVERLQDQKRRIIASQKAGFAKSGVRRTGSVLEVMRQTAQEAEEEALNIQFGAEASSQARLFEGRQAASSGRQARKAGRIGAGATLLRGFGN